MKKKALEKDVAEYDIVIMNGCEFVLWLQKDGNAWACYEDEDEETKESIRKEAWDMYEYTEKDKFMVIFLKNRGGG